MLRFALVAVLTACGLDEAGTLQANDGGPDVVTNDVIADVISEPGPPVPCSTDASSCTSALQAGWTPIAFAASRTTACPSNFTADDVVMNPQAQADACSCSCTPGQAPSCAIGNLVGTFGQSSQCNGGNNSFNITSDGQCYDWGGTFTVAVWHDWTKLPLTPGTCTSIATLDPNKVSTTGARACEPPPQCEEDVCSGSAPAGFSSCIAHDADVACPSGPFTTKTLVAASIKFDCGTCSACSNTGTGCGVATVDYYANANCTGSLATDTVDGNCDLTGNLQSGASHFKYTSAVIGAACTAGTSTAAPTATGPKTICCRP
jgi:hypothetical protein